MAPKRPATARRRAPEKSADDDAFVAGTMELVAWARRNTQLLVLAGVVLVVAVGGTLYWINHRQGLRTRAVAELEQLQQMVAFGDPEAVRRELESYIDRFGGTPSALEARLVLAQLHLDAGRPSEAATVLQPAVRSLGTPLTVQAGFLLASTYEQQQNWAQAEALYLRLADAAELPFQVRDALAAAARIRASQDDRAGAAELYRRILQGMDDDDPQRGPYEMRLAELEATSGR